MVKMPLEMNLKGRKWPLIDQKDPHFSTQGLLMTCRCRALRTQRRCRGFDSQATQELEK